MPFGEAFERHRIDHDVVEVYRERIASGPIIGVIRQFSKRLVLVERFEADRRGVYSLIRREDVTRLRWANLAVDRLIREVGEASKVDPIAREVQAADWRVALESLQKTSPLVRLFREDATPGLIDAESASVEVGKQVVTGQEADALDDPGRFAVALDHLSRVDFGRIVPGTSAGGSPDP